MMSAIDREREYLATQLSQALDVIKRQQAEIFQLQNQLALLRAENKNNIILLSEYGYDDPMANKIRFDNLPGGTRLNHDQESLSVEERRDSKLSAEEFKEEVMAEVKKTMATEEVKEAAAVVNVPIEGVKEDETVIKTVAEIAEQRPTHQEYQAQKTPHITFEQHQQKQQHQMTHHATNITLSLNLDENTSKMFALSGCPDYILELKQEKRTSEKVGSTRYITVPNINPKNIMWPRPDSCPLSVKWTGARKDVESNSEIAWNFDASVTLGERKMKIPSFKVPLTDEEDELSSVRVVLEGDVDMILFISAKLANIEAQMLGNNEFMELEAIRDGSPWTQFWEPRDSTPKTRFKKWLKKKKFVTYIVDIHISDVFLIPRGC